MPYRRNADLPENVRSVLPAEAQSVFRRVFNATVGDVGEERAFRQAWGALENQGWKKDERTGRWVKKALAEFSRRLEIRKVDDEQGLVFGWASVARSEDGTLEVDGEGDGIESEELEKGVYAFVRDARVASDSHDPDTIGIGVLVESMFFSKAKQEALGIEGQIPEGWWVGFQINDPDLRRAVREGDYQMFSIGGSGYAEEVE